jgi:hypothetical protein
MAPWELSTIESLLAELDDLTGEIECVQRVVNRKLGIYVSVR